MSIPASVPAPVGPGGFQSKGRARAAANNKRYGTPLPILLPESPLYASSLASPPPNTTVVRLGLLSSARAIVPTVIGVLDRDTQSVWVEDLTDMRLLFERGFFGKGSLSRSEPTWRDGRKELLKGGNAANAEKIREQRRKERKQFKIDRAAAMKEAAIKAEAVVAAKKAGEGTPRAGTPKPMDEKAEGGEGEAEEGKGAAEGELKEVEEELDVNALTPQTFLVRPTRPDANRNRGKKAFRRKPNTPGAPSATPAPGTPGERTETTEKAGPTEEELAALAAEKEAEAQRRAEERAREAELDEVVSELVDEREHLQLSYPEALFLASIGVLKIHDPEEVRPTPPLPPSSNLLRHDLGEARKLRMVMSQLTSEHNGPQRPRSRLHADAPPRRPRHDQHGDPPRRPAAGAVRGVPPLQEPGVVCPLRRQVLRRLVALSSGSCLQSLRVGSLAHTSH